MAETTKPSQEKTASKKDIITSQRAKGANQESLVDWYRQEERRVDDLTIQDYRDMLTDGQVSMLWQAIVSTILSAGITIQDDEDFEVDTKTGEHSEEYDFIKKNILSPRWKGGLARQFELTNRIMLRAFIEGFRVFEVIHRVNESGQVELDRLAPRAGKADNDIVLLVDDEGEFDGYRQTIINKPGSLHEVEVRNEGRIHKVVKATYGEEFGSLYGRSGFKSIWYHYDKAHKGMYLNHVGHELGAVKFRKVIAKTSDEAKTQAFIDVLDRVGVEMSVAYKEEDFDLEFSDVSDANVMAVGKEMINLHYDMIAKAFLLQFINLGSGVAETGSRSLGETGKDFFKEGIQQLGKTLIEAPWNTVIADLVKLNFNNDIYPVLKVNPIDDAISNLLLSLFVDVVKTGKVSKSIMAKLQTQASQKLDFGIDEETISSELDQKAQEVKASKQAAAMPTAPTVPTPPAVQQTKKPVQLADTMSEAVEGAEIPSEEMRALFPDELKVKFFEIKEKLDDADLRGKRVLRLALQRQKEDIVNAYIKAIKDGSTAVNALQIQLSDKPKYSDQLVALATEMHEYGKITAANELNKGVPTTSAQQKKDLLTRIQNLVSEQEARLRFRLTNLANSILTKKIELSDTKQILLAESAGRSLLENEFDTFFGTINSAMLGSIIPESFNQGRSVTFAAYTDDIVAYRYVAILDDRTTDFCRALDGSVFELFDPDLAFYAPPNHYSCRSILVAITAQEFKEQGLNYTGAPDELPEFGSNDQFKDRITKTDLEIDRAYRKLKNLNVLPDDNSIVIKDGKVIGSGNVYNRILENITKNLTGAEQREALEALAKLLPMPGKDPIADTVRNLLKTIYGIDLGQLGINIPPAIIKQPVVDDMITKLLDKKGIDVKYKNGLENDIDGEYKGKNIYLREGLSEAEQTSTFLHEVGHVVDEVLGSGGKLFSEGSEFSQIMNDRSIGAILDLRLNTNQNFSSDQFRHLIFGGSGRDSGGIMRSLPFQLRVYYMSPSELFAEGFRQYLEGSTKFRFNMLLNNFYDQLYLKLKASYG